MRLPRRPKTSLSAYPRYLAVLAGRFRTTLLAAALLFGAVPFVFVAAYRGSGGERIGYGEAFHHTYFLLFGQPSLPYVDNVIVELLNVAIPPLGVAVIVDGIVRFAFLALARHRHDKEWVAVLASTYRDHVVVCGAGRVGYRVAVELLELGKHVIVIEKNEDASFVSVLRDRDVPVLIDDIRTRGALERVNLGAASALVCATDDDLANLNVALDARRLNPAIRVVLRLFDDDLVGTVRATFGAEAMSTSAVAAPTIALAALDPRIEHGFRVGHHLMVVSEFVVGEGMVGKDVGWVRDEYGGLTISLRRGEELLLHPRGRVPLERGDRMLVQCEYTDYLRLRRATGEAEAPRVA